MGSHTDQYCGRYLFIKNYQELEISSVVVKVEVDTQLFKMVKTKYEELLEDIHELS